MKPNVRIPDNIPHLRVSSKKTTPSVVWQYDQGGILYNQENYTYDGIMIIEFSKPRMVVEGFVPNLRII